MVNINVLYKYMLCSGSLAEIYSEIFLKLDGVELIRSFQDYLELIKDNFSQSQWEEQTYLLSLVVIHLYREIKIDKNVVDKRKENYANTIETQYFEEFKDMSLNMKNDLAENEGNPYDGLEQLLPSQIMQKPIVSKIFTRLEHLLQREMEADTEDKKIYAQKFMDLLLICFDKKINRRKFIAKLPESVR